MSLLKACEPTCDGPSQRSPALSLKTMFWVTRGGRSSLASAFSMQSSRLHTVSESFKYTLSLLFYVTVHVSQSCMLLCLFVQVCAHPSTYIMSLVCVLFCLRSERSLVLWAGTSATSLMTVTGSVLCSTSTCTARMAPSLGMLSSTLLVGKLSHNLRTSIKMHTGIHVQHK